MLIGFQQIYKSKDFKDLRKRINPGYPIYRKRGYKSERSIFVFFSTTFGQHFFVAIKTIVFRK